MGIKKILILLLFVIAIMGIIAPANAVNNDKEVKLTLDANGGKIGPDLKKTKVSTHIKGKTVNINSVPQRDDHKFKGWYTKKSSGAKVTKIKNIQKSVTLYAQWKKSVIDKTLKIKIEYNDKFTAGYSAGNKIDHTNAIKHEDFDSTGYVVKNLGDLTWVSVGAKKSDDSSKLLKLSVLKGDKVVAEKTTRNPHGEIIINYGR